MHIARHIKQEIYDSKMRARLFCMRFCGIVEIGINSLLPKKYDFLCSLCKGQTEKRDLCDYTEIYK